MIGDCRVVEDRVEWHCLVPVNNASVLGFSLSLFSVIQDVKIVVTDRGRKAINFCQQRAGI